ncbi:HepT-like ribonuclease domain-containing protein [Methanoregula boonei]|jgi:uncharacterized protein with HEPN domain|uniref:HepT-like ribonuclease domain-containing protein n=1 Tax=Methanoregula boonei TaxID=358766 RepID=UPI0026BB820E
MHRTALRLLDDIHESTEKIEKYIHGISFDEFTSGEMRKDAVIRNLKDHWRSDQEPAGGA